MRLGVVLLSGGLDSTTVTTLAQQQGYRLSALTIRYGQTHDREIESARAVAEQLGVRQRILDGALFGELAWYSALTSPDRFAVPADRSAEAMASGIPVSYVPLRNTLFLTLAAALLESEALQAIERNRVPPAEIVAKIFIAANAIDYSGYPDCRPEYYASVAETLRLGSKLGTEYGIPIAIETPIIDLSKADIVRLATRIGAPIALTWSCYQGGDQPCGRCDSCLLREKGFAEAGFADPALTG